MPEILIQIQKGRRITLPPEIVQAFALKVGDALEVKATDEGILLIPQKPINKAEDEN